MGHAGPCAAHAALAWRKPAAGQRDGSSQPPGRLAWGPRHAVELTQATPGARRARNCVWGRAYL